MLNDANATIFYLWHPCHGAFIFPERMSLGLFDASNRIIAFKFALEISWYEV